MKHKSVFQAACALSLVAMTTGRALADDAETEAEARKHFMVGVQYLRDPDGERFEDAYNEFKLAYDLSHASKVLGNLALCAMKLERDGEAIDGYTTYLAEVVDIDPEERAQIERDVATLQQSAARVELTVHEEGGTISDTRLPVRGESVANVYEAPVGHSSYRIRPGRHVITLRVAGRERGRWEIVAPAGGSLAHDFGAPEVKEIRPPLPARPSTPVAPIAVSVVGGTTLLTASVLGIVALGRVDSLESKCPDNACPPDAFSDDLATTRSLVRTTDILFLAGAVVTAVGIGWYALSAPSASLSPRSNRPRADLGR